MMIRRFFGWLARRYEEHRTAQALRQLDDRMLRDIGLTRDQI